MYILVMLVKELGTSERLFAVFDIGTTGARSVLVDDEGREVAKTYEEYPPIPRNLQTHEQITEVFWRTSCSTMQRTIAGIGKARDSIIGVVIATTRDCVTPIDKDARPLAPTVTWVDNRSSTKSKEMMEEIGPRKSVNKILWFQEQRPELFERAHKFIHLDAYINHKLCGAMVSDPSNARYGPIDHETLKWSEELCEATGIPMDKLVDIVNPGTVIGEITAEAADATGIPKSTPVIMGSGDQQCSALGTGTIKMGRVKATTGTGTFVITHTDEFIEDPYVMFCNPAAIPGQWLLEGAIPGTGLAFRWYRDQFCETEAAIAEQTGQNVYDIISASAGKIPAGSDGLVVFPFMAYNKGIFYNFGFVHTKAHVARAIMEANGYGIRMYVEMMEGMLDLEFDEIQIDGGGANSSVWRQIIADCTNKIAVLPRSRDSTVIGAAMIAAVGTGVHGSYEEAVEKMYHVEERREPIAENVAVYDKQYTIYNKIMIAEMGELIELTS